MFSHGSTLADPHNILEVLHAHGARVPSSLQPGLHVPVLSLLEPKDQIGHSWESSTSRLTVSRWVQYRGDCGVEESVVKEMANDRHVPWLDQS